MSSSTLIPSRRRRRRGLPILQMLSLVMIFASLGLFLFYLVLFSQQQDRLPGDVSIAGLPLGGLSSREALTQLETVYRQPVVLYYGTNIIALDPAQLEFRLNGDSMLAAATSSGDIQGSFWARFANYLIGQEANQSVDVPVMVTYEQNRLEAFLGQISASYDQTVSDVNYNLDTLTVRSGLSGSQLDVEAALPLVDAALRSPTERVVNLPVVEASAASTDIDTLRQMIVDYLNAEGFIYDGQTTVASIYIQDLTTGDEVNINGDVAFSAASTIKVPILLDYFRRLWVAPSQDEAWLMANSLLCSNNSSSNLLMQITGTRVTGQADDLFGGIRDVTENTQYLGARNTFITAPLFLGVQGQQLGSIPPPATTPNPNFNTNPDPFNQITAEDIGALFSLIYDCANHGSGLIAAYPEGEYTQTECQQMLELMSANDLQRLLQGGIPSGVRISHKNGWVSDMSADAGIVFPPSGRDYVIAVFIWEQAEFQNYERLWPIIEGISRAAWNYFNPDTPLVSARTDLPATAQECVGNFLPPGPDAVDLNNINGWRQGSP